MALSSFERPFSHTSCLQPGCFLHSPGPQPRRKDPRSAAILSGVPASLVFTCCRTKRKSGWSPIGGQGRPGKINTGCPPHVWALGPWHRQEINHSLLRETLGDKRELGLESKSLGLSPRQITDQRKLWACHCGL